MVVSLLGMSFEEVTPYIQEKKQRGRETSITNKYQCFILIVLSLSSSSSTVDNY